MCHSSLSKCLPLEWHKAKPRLLTERTKSIAKEQVKEDTMAKAAAAVAVVVAKPASAPSEGALPINPFTCGHVKQLQVSRDGSCKWFFK